MIFHSGKWDEIGERADNEVMGARIQWPEQKTLFPDAGMLGFILEFLALYFLTLRNTQN